jgi:hypothetical protein
VLCVLAGGEDTVRAREVLERYGEVLETGVSTAVEP